MVAQTAYNTVFRALHAVKNGFNHERQNLDAARDYETRMLFFNQYSSNLELLKTQIQLTNSALDSRTLPHLTEVVVACGAIRSNSNVDTSIQHCYKWSYSAGQLEVAGGAVGNAAVPASSIGAAALAVDECTRVVQITFGR